MTGRSTVDRQEAYHRLADIFGCKWTLAIIDAIRRGVRRPGQIRRQLPDLSAKVLNERIAKLERYGLIQKHRFEGRVPHVEYELTGLGRQLLPVIEAAADFTSAYIDPQTRGA